MIVITNGQYGWETTVYAVAASAATASIKADSKGGGDFEDHFWKDMAIFLVAKSASGLASVKDPFAFEAFSAYGTMYAMGDKYEMCRKKFRNKFSNGKAQGFLCAGTIYGAALVK